MAVNIKVCRGGSSTTTCSTDDDLLNWGDDIYDSLLSTEDAARERGRVEIDLNHKNKLEIEGTISIFKYIDPEKFIQLNEKKGRLISLELQANNTSRKTTIRIESLL